jgi:hypothetical protein
MNNNHKQIAVKVLKIFGYGVLFAAASFLNPKFPYLVLKGYLKSKYNEKYSIEELRNTINYLKRKKFIAYTNGKFTITRVGRKHLEIALAKEFKIKKIKWDEKWRFVTFDIPEDLKHARLAFSYKLKELGFYNFQRSLFVLPFPCEKEIKMLTDLLGITPHVHLLTCSRFKGDERLHKHFVL